MLIYAKSALKIKDIDTKIDIGCDGIEIQLLSELVDGRVGRYFKADEAFELDKFNEYPVKVVHCPLLSSYGLADVNIESFVSRDFSLLEQVCYIADYFGKIQSISVLVVIHSEMNMDNMIAVNILDRVVNIVGYMIMKFRNIEIVLENVTPLRKVYKGEIYLSNNFHFDNIKITNYIRKELNTERVGTCLDTCHAMIADKYMKEIYRILGDLEYKDFSLESFFDFNKDVIKLIHLSDVNGNGYGRGKHGIRFTDKTKDRLKYIIDLYKKYGYTCPITLEVEETDYLICDGYKETRETLLKIL